MVSMTPLAYASSIIGIISFIFTLSIFANTYSEAWDTVLSAPHQIRDYLGNLRQELYEEKEALKRARSRPHGYSLKILDDSIKDLLREFRRIERPFLAPSRRGEGRAERVGGLAGWKRGRRKRILSLKRPGFISVIGGIGLRGCRRSRRR
jgi:hypothetical protein